MCSLHWPFQHSTLEISGRGLPSEEQDHTPLHLYSEGKCSLGVENPAQGGSRGGSLPRWGPQLGPTGCVPWASLFPFVGIYFLIYYRGVGSAWIISEALMETRPVLAHLDLVLCPGSSSDCVPWGKSPHLSVLAVSIAKGIEGTGVAGNLSGSIVEITGG